MACLVKGIDCASFATLGSRVGELRAQGGFAASGRADEQCAGPALHSSVKQGIELGDAAGQNLGCDVDSTMLTGDQARKHAQTARYDDVVMKAFAKAGGAHLQHFETAAGNAIVALQHFQADDPMRDGLHLALGIVAEALVQQQRGAVLSLEELLEAKDLAAIAE